ncbi:MAG: lysophospholipid acyltransferase family protein [Desulfobulbaceae bacterium]|nr:lysophospholipid acyltransferase family protein [Desulfobulbaceae bacterium]
MSVKKKLLYRLSLAVGPFIFGLLTRLLFATCRIRWVGREHLAMLDQEKRPLIAAFWHYGVFLILHLSRGKRQWVAMVSSSKDGEYVAKIVESFGFETVRGSRNRGGIGALKGMVKAVRERGLSAAIVADGSQGPPLVAQPGAVLLASHSGAAVLPVGWAADRYWSFRSWDRTALPKPFARVVMEVGEPLEVPGGLDSGGLEEYRRELERRLLAIYQRCWAGFGRERH